MDYAIYKKEKVVGKAVVKIEGLYYRITCKCTESSTERIRLGVSCGDRKADLGICVPVNGILTVRTTVPIKRLGEGELRFFVLEEMSPSVWIPLKANEAFPNLSRLEQGRFEMQQGKPGIRWKH